jgi:hypothetical protein
MTEQQQAEEVVPIYVTNAISTRWGTGPGVIRVPPAEAARLVKNRRAVYGDQPPRGYLDGGGDGLRH